MQHIRQPLRTLAVVSSKGGSGKTTLALHLAVAAEAAGRRTVVADTDPQKSAWEWRQARGKASPEVAVMQPQMISRFQGPIQRSGYELLIIDTAPFAGPGVEEVIAAADLTLIVARPSMLDLWSVEYSADQARAARGRALFVLTQAPPRRGDVENAAVLAAAARLTGYGFPVAEFGLRARVVYSSAIGKGLTAMEVEPAGVAAREATRLAEAVFGRLWRPALPEFDVPLRGSILP
jgi:chromosome partitioning protein